MDELSGAIVAAFLQDHPEALAGMRMVTLDGQAEPFMDLPTNRRFLLWGVAQGLFEAERVFALLDATEQHFAAREE
jgi:hypothetical protein